MNSIAPYELWALTIHLPLTYLAPIGTGEACYVGDNDGQVFWADIPKGDEWERWMNSPIHCAAPIRELHLYTEENMEQEVVIRPPWPHRWSQAPLSKRWVVWG